MPPDLPNELEIVLKKRAHRRLVGAIALVLLMIIILPRILKDRAATAPQDTIKITMPDAGSSQQVEAFSTAVEPKVNNDQTSEVHSSTTSESGKAEASIDSEAAIETKADGSNKSSAGKSDTENKKDESKKPVVKVEKKAELKIADVKAKETKASESKATEIKAPPKDGGSFTVQVGVYSDIANVKQLQDKLKQAGYTSHTEKISTPKGEKIRLKAGSFASRQDAANALAKLQAAGLPGMVVSNE